MPGARQVGRRFPDYGWAWPTGELDRLLRAVLLADDEAAIAAAIAWLSRNDIDVVSFREHRLLAAAADRFGKRLAVHPAYPRLAGLQKMLWSRSRLAYREARPALATISERTGRPMLFKGASRVVLDPASQRGRVSHDIDLLVRPEKMADAFHILADQGWQAATGAGLLHLKARAASLAGMNFYKGTHGDLDVHRDAYRLSQASREDDEALWERASVADLDGVAVLVPSPTDRVAIAIAHGGIDGHSHSDWLIDIDWTVRHAAVDWAELVGVLRMRKLLVPAAAALTYLADIGTPIPRATLDEIVAEADKTDLWQRASLLRAKPHTDLNWLSGAAHSVFLEIRSWHWARPRDPLWRGRAERVSGLPATRETIRRVAIPRSAPCDRPLAFEIKIGLDIPRVYRRIEFELSTESRHIARLQYRATGLRAGTLAVSFSGTAMLKRDEAVLTLEARPARHFRRWDNRRMVARYSVIPFALIAVRIDGAPAEPAEAPAAAPYTRAAPG